MEDTVILKGELMEEKLRQYFLNNGYYVARGVKYKYDDFDITDIDLFLYSKVSSLSRERINVDIKNKKTPKAFERIIWTKGLQNLLSFDSCVVATSEKRDSIRQYGKKHNVLILDGDFLQRLNYKVDTRITEDAFIKSLVQIKCLNVFGNQNWSTLYEDSKSRLLNELDFSGFNKSLATIKYFIEKCFDPQKQEQATRALYATLSHSLIILDYVLRDIMFLELNLRKETLSDGFKFGNLGREGVNKTIDMAIKITNSKIPANVIKQSIDTNQTDILVDFFSKSDVSKYIFKIAVDLENKAFSNTYITPDTLEVSVRSLIYLFLDFFGVNRKLFNDIYCQNENDTPNI